MSTRSVVPGILVTLIAGGLFLVLASTGTAAKINFLAVADPQFGWGACEEEPTNKSNWERALWTMQSVGQLTRLCSDCPKILPIAGDLRMETSDIAANEKYRTRYLGARTSVENKGVKVLDGLGNHDLDPFGANEAAFVSPQTLGSGASWAKGWNVFDSYPSKVCDADQNGYYCKTADALYYTIALAPPGTYTPAAYLVQLHNEMGSDNSVKYLERLAVELGNRGNQNLPVILVGHKVDRISGSGFRSAVKRLNVAAILYGHYHCMPARRCTSGDKPGDHCDYLHNHPDLLIDANGDRVENKKQVPIPRLNVNAALHNIFWGISVDTSAETVSFKRFNRGRIGDADQYQAGSFENIVAQVKSRGSMEGYNLPINADFLTCKFGGGETRSCREQIREHFQAGSLTAALTQGDTTYLFYSNGKYARAGRNNPDGVDNGYPWKLPGGWQSWPKSWEGGIGAALSFENGEISYMFREGAYTRLRNATVESGYPKAMPGGWVGMPSGWNGQVDAAFYYPPYKSHFLLRGNEYVRLEGVRVMSGYPKKLPGGWVGMPADFATGVDAATYRGGHTYFFKGDQYVRFTGTQMDPGYPRPIEGSFWDSRLP